MQNQFQERHYILLMNWQRWMEFGFECQKFGKLTKYQKYLAKQSHIAWYPVEIQNKKIVLPIEQSEIDNIAGAYLAVFCDTGEGGLAYLLSTDSDVSINRAGYLKATIEEEYWGLKDEVLCLIEMVNTDEYTEYRAPVLYNDELCMMCISFSENEEEGKINAIVPIDTEKQQYELKKGDVLYPLYPLEQIETLDLIEESKDENSESIETKTAEKSSMERIYKDSYYIGNQIKIESEEDSILMMVKIDIEKCMFGFMIQDTKQKIYYTDVISKN